MAARFVDVSEPVIDKFKENAVPQKPNWYAPKFGVKLFNGRLIKFLLQVTQFIENWKSPRINLIFLHFHPVVIKGWSVSALFSHLVGGMKYYNGKLTVPTTGRYCIYFHAYYRSRGRVYVYVNSKRVPMSQFPWPGKGDRGTPYTVGICNLKSGDVIALISAYDNCTIYMYTIHTYFGAYLILKCDECRVTTAP